ncbi:transporter substrate-binding protein [Microbacterium sp. X-17]|uniref:transporter substrate-binding protein n=1 Tax=Microbacterium sp. X-17 TaxID=3144404 RepID=UPI0031F4B51B
MPEKNEVSRRSLLGIAGAGVAAASLTSLLTACTPRAVPAPASSTSGGESGTIKLGVLFSLSGDLAIAETAMHNGTMLAIEEINAAGGILGRTIQPVVADYASDFKLVVEKAQYLVDQGVAATVGCYSSASRKAVLPVFEKADAVLVYPTFYEGLECSTNVIYSSLVANQHLTDASEWMVENLGKRIYMVGSDYVGPQTYNAIVSKLTQKRGATVVQNRFFPLGQTEFGAAISDIKATKPDVVWCTLVGDSVPAFYKQMLNAGLSGQVMPIMAGITTEQELAAIDTDAALGHYFPSSYFATMTGNGNKAFVNRYQAKFGSNQPTNMPVEASYTSVYLVKAAIEKAHTANPKAILAAFPGVTVNAPGEGQVTVTANHHTTHPIFLGRANKDRLYDVVATFKPRKPDPFPADLVGAENVPMCPRRETT